MTTLDENIIIKSAEINLIIQKAIIAKQTENPRYRLRQGKFGMYFYDKETEWDMPLKDVLMRLNQFYKSILEGRADHYQTILDFHSNYHMFDKKVLKGTRCWVEVPIIPIETNEDQMLGTSYTTNINGISAGTFILKPTSAKCPQCGSEHLNGIGKAGFEKVILWTCQNCKHIFSLDGD